MISLLEAVKSSCEQLKAVESSWKQLQLAKCSNEQALSRLGFKHISVLIHEEIYYVVLRAS